MLLLIMQGLAAAALGAPAELEKVSREFAVPQYTQELTARFASPEAAARAGFRIAPLFEGRERAISCRWDDNHPGTVGARDRMNAHGIKGTYYLHGTEGDYHFAGDFMPIAKQLFEGGHSIGGHGLTHPYLTYVNRNRMFEEVMGIRIFWESQLDTTLNSYTFSFVNYRSEAEGDLVQRDITHCLERAGFYHVATFKTFDDHLKTDLLFSIIMPPENQDLEAFKQGVDWAESSEDLKERFPLISNSMHPWYDSPNLPQYGWDELDRRLDYLGRNPDHWRANQNEYAAYWAQSRLGRIEVTGREGGTVRLRLTRPTLDYLNDATPVTVQVEGVASAEVASFTCATAETAPAARELPGMAQFNVGHDRARALPARVAEAANPENADSLAEAAAMDDFPGLQVLLSFAEPVLSLKLQNGTSEDLADLRIQGRLPLGWAPLDPVELGDIATGATRSVDLPLTYQDIDEEHRAGTAFFTAQLDFTLRGEAGRVFATCHHAFPENPVFPRDHFVVLGPIAPAAFDLDAFDAAMETGLPENWTDREGSWHPWRFNHQDGPVKQEYLGWEVLRTQADWFVGASPVYILRGHVVARGDTPFRIAGTPEDLKRVYLNGTPLDGLAGTLKPGRNEFVLVQHCALGPGSPRHAGLFFRLTEPGTGARLSTIRYETPEVEPVPTTLKVALLQMLPDGSNQEANLAKAVEFCRKAEALDADIALFPEMFNIGYMGFMGLEEETIRAWKDQAVGQDDVYVRTLCALARELDMAIGATYLEDHADGPRNAISLIDRHGKILYTYGKIHTCDFAAFEAVCAPGEDWHVATLDTQCGPVQVGAMICYDREFPESARILMLKGAEIVLTPNACPLDDVRLHQFQTRGYENSMAMFMTNYPAPIHGGRSVAYGAQGEPLFEAPEAEGVYLAEVNLPGLREHRKRSIWGNTFRRPHKYGQLLDQEVAPVFQRVNAFGEPFKREER